MTAGDSRFADPHIFKGKMMSKGLLQIIVENILKRLFDTNEVRGRYGEFLTERELNIVNLFGRKGMILRNVYIPKDNEETSEIDLLFITQKGIFVIESKNYSGWIFGNENEMRWTAMLPNRQKNSFYNPIKQNQTHIKWLVKYLKSDVPLFSLIIFSDRCTLKKVVVDSHDTYVIHRTDTYKTIRKIWDSSPDRLSNEEIEVFFDSLNELTNIDSAKKAMHISSINQKYKANKETILNPNPMLCPKCGAELVLRTAKNGQYAGNQFYGCSKYPHCRYIKNL